MTSVNDDAFWRQGKVWISIVAIITSIGGWLVYDAMTAPRWMRDFGLEMAARATVTAPMSEESAFSTMRGREEPDHPYICLGDIAPFDWDRVFVVTSGGPLPPKLSGLSWPSGENEVAELNMRLAGDSRYQLIAFEFEGAVVDHGFYFTLWADLSDLSHRDGFSRQEAVFVASSDGESYRVTTISRSDTTPCAG